MEENIIRDNTINDNNFNIFIPLEFEKGAPNETDVKKKLLVKGIASTMRRDTDGEILDPNGFDFTNFLTSGHFNWDHKVKKDPLAIIGEPFEKGAFVKNNKFHVEGWLYPESDLAQRVYKLGELLQKSGSNRRLGMSVEGKVLKRKAEDPKWIEKAEINHIAIAPAPKNRDTVFDIVKGNSGEMEANCILMKGNAVDTLEYDLNSNLIDEVLFDSRVIVKSDFTIHIDDMASDELSKASDADIIGAAIIISIAHSEGLLSDEDMESITKSCRDSISIKAQD